MFEVEVIAIELLLIISIVAITVRRFRIPYTVALVAVGLAISILSPFEAIELTPQLILALFVPPLIFEAAFQLELKQLLRELPGILILVVPGVIVTMLIVATVVTLATTLPFEVALVFGALISATDPVAVIALFRTLGVPKRLALLVEGESLLNDGTAIVMFHLMLVVALTGNFNPINGVLDFIRVVAGGLAIGAIIGNAGAWLIARVDDHLIEITLTTVVAFGSYILAEELGFSGVLAVVAAGLINGNLSSSGMSPTTRIILNNLWEYLAFLSNSFIFLLIGTNINIPDLIDAWQSILWAIIAVLTARVIVIYGLGMVASRLNQPISLRYQHIMVWGGLRGAISIALALSLPFSLGSDRVTLRVMTFGVVLFTLFIQGATIGTLLKRLGIVSQNETQTEYELRHARLVAAQSASDHLNNLHKNGLISQYTWEKLRLDLGSQLDKLTDDVHTLLEQNPDLAQAEVNLAEEELLRAQRSILLQLRRQGVLSDEAFEKIAIEIDEHLHLAHINNNQ